MQVAGSPTRIAICVINTNYTCDLIKESGVFAITLLDQTAGFELIQHFGFQSGRNVDKFANLRLPEDVNGIPYLAWQACAVISGKVVNSLDLGTHTMFIAEVVDAKVLSEEAPLTYADYQDHLKPKKKEAKEQRPIKGFRCRICGYVYEGTVLPEDFLCPLCGHGPEDFEPIFAD
jgi:flavin reductase (DIM6/NTAB) family NADH-FMN oxidoreductase RutF/rubredoxin